MEFITIFGWSFVWVVTNNSLSLSLDVAIGVFLLGDEIGDLFINIVDDSVLSLLLILLLFNLDINVDFKVEEFELVLGLTWDVKLFGVNGVFGTFIVERWVNGIVGVFVLFENLIEVRGVVWVIGTTNY